MSRPTDPRPPLIALVGPTAVGKTALSLELAAAIGGEIVSADSRLLYRGLDIGTAKPTPAERAQVPHHLVDVADPDEVWSLGQYQDAAFAALDDIVARGRVPLLVGGTGQYVWAVVENWRIPRVPPQPRLRAVLEAWGRRIGPEALHRRLAMLDPAAAARIQPRNLRRTVRALEVIFVTGRRFSAQRGKGPPRYRTLMLGLWLPRSELHRRIAQRLNAMLAQGWLDEVRALLAQGYDPALPALSGIGYAELIGYLQGRWSLEEAKARILHRTHTFVRRQANWFRRTDPRIRWFRSGPGVLAQVLPVVRAFLAGEENAFAAGPGPGGAVPPDTKAPQDTPAGPST